MKPRIVNPEQYFIPRAYRSTALTRGAPEQQQPIVPTRQHRTRSIALCPGIIGGLPFSTNEAYYCIPCGGKEDMDVDGITLRFHV